MNDEDIYEDEEDSGQYIDDEFGPGVIDEPEIITEEQLVAGAAPHLYRYTPVDGLVYIGMKSNRTTVPVANFDIAITRELIIINDALTEQFYELTITKPGFADITFSLSGEEMGSALALAKLLSKLLPSSHIIYADGSKHINPAARERSKVLVQEVRYGAMGWASDMLMPIYILPGMAEAITSRGPSPLYHLHDSVTKKLPPRMRLYGDGVRLIATPQEEQLAQEAFSEVLARNVVAPAILTQVLAAPYVGLVGRDAPPLMHIYGKTGILKSSLCLLCLNLVGSFGKNQIIETWLSSINALSRRLYEARDVTLMIDDYRSATKGGPDPTPLIQAYADGTARSRMGSDQENRETLLPRGLLLSTGEDAWDSAQSVEARTIAVPMEQPSNMTLDQYKQSFTRAQALAKDGHLAHFYAEWIYWLAKQDKDQLHDLYDTLRAKHAHTIGTAANVQMHARLQEMLAGFAAIGEEVSRFLASRFPALQATFDAAWLEAWAVIMEAAEEHTIAASLTSPYEMMIDALHQGLTTGTIKFIERNGGSDLVAFGAIRPRAVGYCDDDYIYLTKSSTYQWALEQARLRGATLWTWAAFNQGAKSALGPLPSGLSRVAHNIKVFGRTVSTTAIPRDLIAGSLSTPSSGLTLDDLADLPDQVDLSDQS